MLLYLTCQKGGKSQILNLKQQTDPYSEKSDRKNKEREQKLSGELYLPDISVCNTNLQQGQKRKMSTDKR